MTDTQKQSPDGKVHEPKFSKVPPDLTHDLTVTDGAVRLYAHMYWRYWSSGDNYEGQTTMAIAMGVSEVTISKRIHELEFHDWVVVVELERSKDSGNYLTPFYHVFVEQKDAIAFRKSYKCKPNETIRPKPAKAREKKSRKGKGGKPANILKYNESKGQSPVNDTDRTNSSLGGNHTNSSWDGGTNLNKDGGTNSSWYELDSPALDSGLDSNPPIPPYPIPDIQEQADEVIAKVAAITPNPVDEDQAARLLIKAYLGTTKSADTGMVNSNPRNQEALKLYDLGMTPFHIGLYLKRNKTEAGYWQGKNVPWKVLIGEIVSHFETRPAVTYTFVPEVPIPPVVISDGPKANFTIEEFDALLEATSKAMDF